MGAAILGFLSLIISLLIFLYTRMLIVDNEQMREHLNKTLKDSSKYTEEEMVSGIRLAQRSGYFLTVFFILLGCGLLWG